MDLIAAILVVTATAGFRHDSIPTAESVIAQIGQNIGVQVEFARNEAEAIAAFNNLGAYRAVMFVHTTGEIAVARRPQLLQWIADGGTFIGVHAAADTWHESAEYIDMLGAEFVTHPAEYTAIVETDDAAHPSTVGLLSPRPVFEEIYTFGHFSLDRVRLLMSIHDPEFQPLAWEKSYGRGRVLYSALGHRSETWNESWFQQHIRGAMLWAEKGEGPLRRRAASAVRRP